MLAVVITGMALALAVAKPWAAGGGAAASSPGPGASSGADSSGAPATAATGASGDTPTASGDAPVGPPGLLLAGAGRGVIPLPGGGTLDCADPQGWRVVLDATTDGLATRTWVAVVPGPGTGPLDPTLPLARIASGPVEGLGFCAPVTTVGGAPTAWTVGVWRVDRGTSGTPRATRLAWIGPATGGLGGLARAGGLPGAPGVWAPGRYALQLQARGGYPGDAWLVVESCRRPDRARPVGQRFQDRFRDPDDDPRRLLPPPSSLGPETTGKSPRHPRRGLFARWNSPPCGGCR